MVHQRWSSHRTLALVGPTLTLVTLVFWALGLWIGWWLVFSSDPEAVVESTGGEIAGAIDRLYFVGYTLSTMGLEDFKPVDNFWQLLTVLVSVNGLILFTMAITYIVPLRESIHGFLEIRGHSDAKSTGCAPAAPDTNALTDAELPVETGRDQRRAMLRRHEDRRQRLADLLIEDGWAWGYWNRHREADKHG